MTKLYEEIYEEIIVGKEKGYVNHASDLGGETIAGIARKSHPNNPIWAKIDALKKSPNFPNNIRMADFKEEFKKFYYDNYYTNLKIDKIPSKRIQVELFEVATNMGPKFAGTFLQRALNIMNRRQRDWSDIKVDGAIGNATIEAYNKAVAKRGEAHVYKALNAFQAARFIDITEVREANEDFFNGWLERV